jgi:hypothetical protein
MLQALQPTTIHTHNRTRSLNTDATMADTEDLHDGSDDDEGGKDGARSKSRRELPAGAVAALKAWLLSPEHFTHPYPTPQDQIMLMQKTGIDKKQLKNWFTNARRRIWKPMLKKQLEQGKLTATGPGGGGVAVPGVASGLMVPTMPGGLVGQSDQVQYQQPVQNGQQPEVQQQVSFEGLSASNPFSGGFRSNQDFFQVQMDQYGNPIYPQQASLPHPGAPQPGSQSQYYDPSTTAPGVMPLTSSIGSLAHMSHSGSGMHLSKTDSHAVLMELFARDQDLVRQATESTGLKGKQDSPQQTQYSMGQLLAPQPAPGQPQQVSSQHPMKTPSQGRLLGSVPTLNSWPHFSSVSSLNNLGTMPGVKSITSLSGADLAKQGPVNTVSNIAQVKSVESMGKNDSYAFLEVFFGDRSSLALNTMGNSMGSKDQRGIKRERDEDNDVGLSLEDESPSTTMVKQEGTGNDEASAPTSDMNPTPFMSDKDSKGSTGTLKRAYDDALAARGLMSVSRSCEKLTDLALPAKMQRSLSQEYLRPQPQPQQAPQHYGQYQYNLAPAPAAQTEQVTSNQNQNSSSDSQQYPGQHPGQQPGQSHQQRMSLVSDPNDTNASIEVPSATKCALCHQTNVDTQLRPCGHMFHERCLKPSLQAPMGPPKCPVDHIPMKSALLAVPTDEVRHNILLGPAN